MGKDSNFLKKIAILEKDSNFLKKIEIYGKR